jgi:hypothetical protein
MADQTNAQRFLENAMASQMPALRQQQEGMRRYLQGQGQRVGAKGAAQQARQAVDVYATQAGDVAARLGADAERMGQAQDQFETQQSNFEKQFAETQKQNEMTNLMNQYQLTGVWTQEMLDAFGYDPSAGGQNQLERDLEALGLTQGTGTGINSQSSTGGINTANMTASEQALYSQAMMPLSQFSTKTQRNQQAYLQSLFG